MRKFSQFCWRSFAVSALTLVLTCSTLAGTIPYPGVTAPPPVTTEGEMQFPTAAPPSETADGDTQFPGVAVDSVTGLALALWQSAMALF